MVFEFAQEVLDLSRVARLKVVGIGGAGGNAVNRMIAAGLSDVDFIAVNTDHQVLERSAAPLKLRIGTKLTKGLGAGGFPELGKKAAEEDRDVIAEHLEDTDMLFVTAGMGGGTGTGAGPIISKLAKEMGILTVAVVTKPFNFEGKTRYLNAEQGIDELKGIVDTLIIIPNEKLLTLVERDTTFADAFAKADEVLFQATQGISELITKPGLINLDFADVRSVLEGMGGDALMGTGVASGEGRAIEAARRAISSPLMDNISITGAKGVLINITGDPTLALAEAAEAANLISEQAGTDANIIFGVVLDEALQDEVRITVIAAGFQKKSKLQKQHVQSSIQQRYAQSMDMFDGSKTQPVHERPYEISSPEPVRQEQPIGNIQSGQQHAPTFIPATEQQSRQQSPIPETQEELVPVGEPASPGLMDFSPDDYEVPAFMRKKQA